MLHRKTYENDKNAFSRFCYWTIIAECVQVKIKILKDTIVLSKVDNLAEAGSVKVKCRITFEYSKNF